jgi:hypothetical protein
VLQEHVPAGLAGVDADAVCGGGRAGRGGGQRRELFFFAFARRGRFDILTELRETRRGTRDAPLVMMALVAAGTLNSSAAYLSTAVNGASSGTLSLFGGGRGRTRERRGFPIDRLASPERRGAVGRTRGAVDARRRETTRRTYTRNGNLGSDVSVILKETFDIITGCGRSCATRANLEVPSGSARGPLGRKARGIHGQIFAFCRRRKSRIGIFWPGSIYSSLRSPRFAPGQLALTRLVFTGYP